MPPAETPPANQPHSANSEPVFPFSGFRGITDGAADPEELGYYTLPKFTREEYVDWMGVIPTRLTQKTLWVNKNILYQISAMSELKSLAIFTSEPVWDSFSFLSCQPPWNSASELMRSAMLPSEFLPNLDTRRLRSILGWSATRYRGMDITRFRRMIRTLADGLLTLYRSEAGPDVVFETHDLVKVIAMVLTMDSDGSSFVMAIDPEGGHTVTQVILLHAGCMQYIV